MEERATSSADEGSPCPQGRLFGRVRWFCLRAGFVLGVVVVYGIGDYFFGDSPVQPPTVDSTALEPAVAQVIEGARVLVQRRPRSAQAWGLLGKVFRAHDFFSQAEACFRQAEKLDPTDPRWPYLLARSPGIASDEAFASLEQAVARRGSAHTPRLALAEALTERGRWEEAERHFQQVLKEKPDEPRAHLGLGRIALLRNDLTTSLDHLTRSVQSEPAAKATHMLLAQVLSRLGREQDAAEEIRQGHALKALWVWPDPYIEECTQVWVGFKARLTQAQNLRDKGHVAEAVERLRSLVKDYPESADAYMALGQTLNRAGNAHEAELALRESARLRPHWSTAHFEWAFALQSQGKLSDAMDRYRRAIELQPNYALAYFNLSFCLEQQGDDVGATDAVRSAVRYNPDLADAHVRLAGLLARQGLHEESQRSLDRANRVAPVRADVRDKRIEQAPAAPPLDPTR